MMRRVARFLPDGFTLSILAIVILGAFFPCEGEAARWVGIGSKVAIGLLFFLQGARLSRAAVLAGILHWRLHLLIFTSTFIVFPLLGLALGPVSELLIASPLYVGLLFLCCLPSTVQASVIFTSIAGGNVAAALCSAWTWLLSMKGSMLPASSISGPPILTRRSTGLTLSALNPRRSGICAKSTSAWKPRQKWKGMRYAVVSRKLA